MKHIFLCAVAAAFLFSGGASAQTRTYIQPGELYLQPGQTKLLGTMTFEMLADGNLILRTNDGMTVWSTELATPCPTCVAAFENTGRFTIRDAKTGRIRANVAQARGKFLVIQDTYPFLALYNRNVTTVDGFPVFNMTWEAGVTPISPATRPGFRANQVYPTSVPPAFDYMVQDVCLDEQGMTTGEDPAVCANHRNIRIGEDVPYILSDWAWKQSYLHIFNVPALLGNKLRVINMREFGKNSVAPNYVRAFGDFDLNGSDGYDVFEMDGEYTSSTGTQDPVTNNTRFFWYNDQCQPEDGWIFFPSNLAFGQSGFTVASLWGGSCTLGQPFSKSLTVWENYVDNRVFTNGKSLNGTVSFHFATDKPGSLLASEVFYFTREYGFNRWESWSSNPDALEKFNSGNCNGLKQASFYGEAFYRHACRDWTTFIPSKLPRTAFSVPLDPAFVTSRNLLRSADFANGVTDGWNTGSIKTEIKPDPITGNYQAWLDCTQGCPAPGLNQSMALEDTLAAYSSSNPFGRYKLQGGLTLTAAPNTSVNVIVHLWGPNNLYYGPHGLTVTMPKADMGPRPVRFRIVWDQFKSPLSRALLEISSSKPAGLVGVDDTFFSILPSVPYGTPPLSATTTEDDN